ncbi:hypothetical protein JCM10212_003022 [Sporobolomyces blumeae]
MGLIDSLGFGKHSTFAAEIKIHELVQVPLRDARFRLKWRAKDATTHGVAVTQFAESLVQRSDESQPLSSHIAEAGRRLLQPVNHLVDGRHVSDSGRNEMARSLSPGGASSSSSATDGFRTPDVLSPLMSPTQDSTTPNPNRTPMPQSIHFNSPFSRTSTQTNDEPSPNPSRISRSRTSDGQSNMWSSSTSSTLDDTTSSLNRRRGGGDLLDSPITASSHHRLEPKGSTSFVPLRTHTATFERTIICPVNISARQSSQLHRYVLQPSSFKISIKQEGIDREGHRQPEEKYGEVNLDLSQFVGKEVKPRRFLLANCKTNTILRLTVKMEFLEGETHYIAPSMVTGQIMPSPSKSLMSSARNSPSNRSTTSLATSPRKTPSSLHSGFSPSLQMSRSASTTSSIASDSTSMYEGSRPGSRAGSIKSTTDETRGLGRTGRANKVVGPNGRRRIWRPPGSAGGYSVHGSTNHAGERSAADVIESIFNRQPETPASGVRAWHTHSGGVSGVSTPRSGYSEHRKARGKDKNLGVPGEKEGSATSGKKAAWSIRSLAKSRRARSPSRQASLDAPSVAPSTSTSSSILTSDSPRHPPTVSIHPPDSDHRSSRPNARTEPSFASTASTARAPSPSRTPPSLNSSTSSSFQQTPRQRSTSYRSTSYSSSYSSTPPRYTASPPSSPESRPLSVRFDDLDSLDGSPPLLRKSPRHRTSTDDISRSSTHSSNSIAGLGLSASTLAKASSASINTPRSSMDRRPSVSSFNSVVTPPSPERTPIGPKRREASRR